MDQHARKALKGRASQAVGQGWKSMAVEPAQVLELTREYRPPSELHGEIVQLQAELTSKARRIEELERQLRTAYDRGVAEGAAKHMAEIKRLRGALGAHVAAADRAARAERLGRTGRAREVGTPV